jgi:hypothetical protein
VYSNNPVNFIIIRDNIKPFEVWNGKNFSNRKQIDFCFCVSFMAEETIADRKPDNRYWKRSMHINKLINELI